MQGSIPGRLIVGLLGIITLTGCASMKQSSKFGFNEGYYKSRLFHKKLKSVYVLPVDDSIKVYTVKGMNKDGVNQIDALKIAFPADEKPGQFDNYVFRHNSLDIDVLSIFLKYRPAVEGFPNQLNTSILNGALYIGYRTDQYLLKYKINAFGLYKRDITHLGFSFGAFTGIGATTMNESVTLSRVSLEYDGFINPTGVAAILAMNRVSFALSLGVDHLLDKNHNFWIYQGKPCIGLGVGLNLN